MGNTQWACSLSAQLLVHATRIALSAQVILERATPVAVVHPTHQKKRSLVMSAVRERPMQMVTNQKDHVRFNSAKLCYAMFVYMLFSISPHQFALSRLARGLCQSARNRIEANPKACCVRIQYEARFLSFVARAYSRCTLLCALARPTLILQRFVGVYA